MSLHGDVVEANRLRSGQRDEMYALMVAYYGNVHREVFETDLAEKSWVILLVDERRQVQGFSTQMLIDVESEGVTATALFSGDTIVHRAWWGQSPLSRIWGRLAWSLIDHFPDGSLYWFLISKGYRTYRFLPLFFHKFWPRYELPLPSREAALLTAFARHKFGQQFDEKSSVVRAGGAQNYLRPGVADISSARRRDPHVAFFEQQNPGHVQGDELCCLAPLMRDNFTAAALRVMEISAVPSAHRRPLGLRPAKDP